MSLLVHGHWSAVHRRIERVSDGQIDFKIPGSDSHVTSYQLLIGYCNSAGFKNWRVIGSPLVAWQHFFQSVQVGFFLLAFFFGFLGLAWLGLAPLAGCKFNFPSFGSSFLFMFRCCCWLVLMLDAFMGSCCTHRQLNSFLFFRSLSFFFCLIKIGLIKAKKDESGC